MRKNGCARAWVCAHVCQKGKKERKGVIVIVSECVCVIACVWVRVCVHEMGLDKSTAAALAFLFNPGSLELNGLGSAKQV